MRTAGHPNLTARASDILACAHDLADQRGDVAVTPAHVVLGLLAEGQNVAVAVLSARGVPLDALVSELTAALPAPGAPRTGLALRGWTPAAEAFAVQAQREARELDSPYYGTEHLLLALLRDPAGVPAQVLARYGVAFEDVRADLRGVLFSSPDARSASVSNRDDG